jgi:ribosomal protein RSM22 (predicted rRNA methylase)
LRSLYVPYNCLLDSVISKIKDVEKGPAAELVAMNSICVAEKGAEILLFSPILRAFHACMYIQDYTAYRS